MSRQIVIENPILNSPFAEPARHFRFDKEGITNEVLHERRISGYFIPMACKMATGSGKTVVMAMIIAWQTLNKVANPQDARFSDAFLLVAPGITIRDRLRVLLPNDPQNYYAQRDIVPPALRDALERAKIVITNFHVFKPREKVSAGKLIKAILGAEASKAFTETPGEMVRRVCRELGNKKNIIVLNDEAHHCYRHKPEAVTEKLKGEEREEAERREEAARIWISGLAAVKEKQSLWYQSQNLRWNLFSELALKFTAISVCLWFLTEKKENDKRYHWIWKTSHNCHQKDQDHACGTSYIR